MAAPGRKIRWTLPVLLLALLGVGGCYHYTPLHLDQVTPTQDIRARVTLQEAERIEGLLPTGRDPRVVEGRVAEILRETLYLDVTVTTQLQGTRVESFNQRLDIPMNGILEVERRELSRGRTAALVIGGAALLGSFVAIRIIDSGGEGSRPDNGGPAESRGPLSLPLSIPLRP